MSRRSGWRSPTPELGSSFADSNRFHRPGRGAQLTVVDPAAALAGRPAVTGTIRSGSFPREMSLELDGTLLVSNLGSDQLQAIDTHGLG